MVGRWYFAFLKTGIQTWLVAKTRWPLVSTDAIKTDYSSSAEIKSLFAEMIAINSLKSLSAWGML